MIDLRHFLPKFRSLISALHKMPNHDTVLRRVEMIAARVQANNDKRRAIIDASNKRQLVTENGQVEARMNNMAPGIKKVFLAQRLVAIKST